MAGLSARGTKLARGDDFRNEYASKVQCSYDEKSNPRGIVNLGVSENFCMMRDSYIYAREHMAITTADLTYGEGPWGSLRLREATAKYMNRYFAPTSRVTADEILFAAGCTALFEILGWNLADAGECLLLARPCYQSFVMDFSLRAKVRCRFVRFEGDDQFTAACVSHYERAYHEAVAEGSRPRFVLLCNPHNPLGRCYTPAGLQALMDFCAKYDLHLVSDEVYAMSVYDIPSDAVKADMPPPVGFTSSLSIISSTSLPPERLHVLYGFSKDFAASGLRLGCVQTRNSELLRAMGNINAFAWIASPSQALATAMLEDETWVEKFLIITRKRLSERNVMARRLLNEGGAGVFEGEGAANAGLFLWVDLRPWLGKFAKAGDGWQREADLSNKMIQGGVFLTTGQSMAAEEPGFFRVIFSQEEHQLREGLRRLFAVLGPKPSA